MIVLEGFALWAVADFAFIYAHLSDLTLAAVH